MPSPDRAPSDDPAAFRVRVGAFDGPFDLLLNLIAARELDITEVSLAQVTDEFLAHLKALPGGGDLEQASGFLTVGATLLDLKIAGLLPQGEVVDAEDVALLEARDLLFARLLQYRAFKEVSGWFEDALAAESARHPRAVPLEERFRERAAPLELDLDVAAFAALAAVALTPRPEPQVDTGHLHAPAVSLREQAAVVVAALRGRSGVPFASLAGEQGPAVVVARFVVVLELYRLGAIAVEQTAPLGVLTLTWTAADWDEGALTALGDWDGEAA